MAIESVPDRQAAMVAIASKEDAVKALYATFQTAYAAAPENKLALQRQLQIDIDAALAA